MPPTVLVSAWLAVQALTFSQALSIAETAPSVEASRAAQQARRQRADEVSSFTYNPTLQVQPGVRAPKTGGAQPELYLSASQRFNAAGLSDARRQTLQYEGRQDQAATELARRLTRESVARAWFDRFRGQAAYDLAVEELALIETLVAGAEAALAAGEGTRVEVEMLRGFRAEVALNALRWEGETFDAGLALTRALGQSDAAPTATAGALPEVATPSFVDNAVTARPGLNDVADTPQVIAARAEQATQRARLAETRAARGATYALGAMAFREGGGDVAVLATLDVDLPLFEAGERERATVAAEVALADGRAEQALVDARTQHAAVVHELEHAQQVVAVTEGQLLVAALALADAQHQRWLAREATAQEWIQARRAVLQAKVTTLQAQTAFALARFLVGERFGKQHDPHQQVTR